MDPSQYAMTPAQEAAQELYTQERTQFMTVTPQETMRLDVSVDEMDIRLLSPGQKAIVTLDALPGRSYVTGIDKIDTVGRNAGGSSKFNVSMTLERTDGMLDGMNASAIIPLKTCENVLTVPVEALVEIGDKTYVYRAYDQRTGLTGLTEVTTGISDGNTAQILSGLSAGDTVWYESYDRFEQSNKVERPKGRFG